MGGLSTSHRPAPDPELLLRETNHRCANDLQLVVSLLALQGRRATHPETRDALADAGARVGVLARARAALAREQSDLQAALAQVCEAIAAPAEPRGVLVTMETELGEAGPGADGLSSRQVTTVALAVNELATNAIKHAFAEGEGGRVAVSARRTAAEVVVVVDDDGLPFPELDRPRGGGPGGGGLGLELVKRLVASIGGLVIPPPPGTKRFELRIPFATDRAGHAR